MRGNHDSQWARATQGSVGDLTKNCTGGCDPPCARDRGAAVHADSWLAPVVRFRWVSVSRCAEFKPWVPTLAVAREWCRVGLRRRFAATGFSRGLLVVCRMNQAVGCTARDHFSH